ncbi:O-phosphoserine sulfhydrylase domain protein [Mycobacterium xenopi 4042]|uniref:O-phosphoserine sulfhydrylase domain protein n=1 Tax=Mycobacterium xenopi 4042 TaxID=1299334 RepID=X8E6B3_MYCXE|nr:O-phosphoserine sulfhydrylase domain protein [Mycobacterium xenopi 4042]
MIEQAEADGLLSPGRRFSNRPAATPGSRWRSRRGSGLPADLCDAGKHLCRTASAT